MRPSGTIQRWEASADVLVTSTRIPCQLESGPEPYDLFGASGAGMEHISYLPKSSLASFTISDLWLHLGPPGKIFIDRSFSILYIIFNVKPTG
jgi:hypothetical protein